MNIEDERAEIEDLMKHLDREITIKKFVLFADGNVPVKIVTSVEFGS